MSGDLRRFCFRYCFKIRRFEVLEVTRLEYWLNPSAPSSLKRAICSVAQALGGQIIEDKFGTTILFKKMGSSAVDFVSMTEALGARVHTLEEHVEFLSDYMKGLRIKDLISEAEEVDLLNIFLNISARRRTIEVFDSRMRRWRRASRGNLRYLPAGTLLRVGSEDYFYVSGSKALKIGKDNAYLLASINFRPRPVFYVVDRRKGIAVVSQRDIGLVPTEVFNTLVRLQPYLKRGAETLMYRINDLDLVSRVLKLVKANLIKIDRVEEISMPTRNLTIHVVNPKMSLLGGEFELLLRCLAKLGLEPLLESGELILLSKDGMRIRCLLCADPDQRPLFIRRRMTAILPLYYFRGFCGLYEALKVCRSLLRDFTDGSSCKEAVRLLLENYREFGREDFGALAEVAVTALMHEEVMEALRKNKAAAQIVKRLASSCFYGKTGTVLDSIDGQKLRRLLQI